MTEIAAGSDQVRAWSRTMRRSGRTVALVPTMGALHRGHLALVERARSLADAVVVSIFVNPLQFGEAADLANYPTPIDNDLAACRAAGVDLVYAPTAATMYPVGFDTRVVPGSLAATMEGQSRPGHFEGVATVVTKLLAAVEPDLAVFGEKDYQQLAIVRRLVIDLDLGVTIVGVPTVREHDGLALSSRNLRLTPEDRAAATAIPRAVAGAVASARSSAATVDGIVAAALTVLRSEPRCDVDYVNVFDADTLAVLERLEAEHRRPGRCRIAVAARFGGIRLIDNADLFDV
ncbi:MAG TPA: pantoate--beta-alanine ligase [Ilumatobacteraceae bacterium]|nr:pantoate--beta-alanine ligase [Ilumatobacteraceae bacterium]